jgi:hypothetical protein
MNILSKTAITAAAALTVSLGAAFMASAPSQAAGLVAPTQLTQNAIQSEVAPTQIHHRRYRRHRPHFGVYIGHGGYYGRRHYRDCFWKTKRRWSSYRGRYVYRKVRVCY